MNCATLQAWMITLPRYLINLSILQITNVFSWINKNNLEKKIFVFWVCLFPGTCLELCQHFFIECNALFKVADWVYAKLTPLCFSKILKNSLWRLRDPWVPASEFLLVPAHLGYCPHSQGFKPFWTQWTSLCEWLTLDIVY